MKFEEAYEEYLIYVSNRHKKQWLNVHQYNFSKNILSYFNSYKLEDITPLLLDKWRNYIYLKSFCNNYNKQLYSMLKCFLEYCIRRGYISSTILYDFIPLPLKIEYNKTDFYTLKEFKRFIKGFDNIVYKTFFEFMFFTGCRPGETMALKFSDINSNYITINKTIDEHGKREIGTPKTNSSNRVIYISNKLKKDLNRLYNTYKGVTFDYFIFGGVKPLTPTTVNRYKIRACNKMNIRPIKLHQFRHSHATYLLNKRIDIHIISKRLGHSKVSTTLDVYTHSNLLQEKRLIKSLNSRFSLF
ncbi:MAG: tyrosine-type recombinase/integrase [Bacilli bacterium]|nr:tyrosine-type recombinase/integrase [Bacilli bacterium]